MRPPCLQGLATTVNDVDGESHNGVFRLAPRLTARDRAISLEKCFVHDRGVHSGGEVEPHSTDATSRQSLFNSGRRFFGGAAMKAAPFCPLILHLLTRLYERATLAL